MKQRFDIDKVIKVLKDKADSAQEAARHMEGTSNHTVELGKAIGLHEAIVVIVSELLDKPEAD